MGSVSMLAFVAVLMLVGSLNIHSKADDHIVTMMKTQPPLSSPTSAPAPAPTPTPIPTLSKKPPQIPSPTPAPTPNTLKKPPPIPSPIPSPTPAPGPSGHLPARSLVAVQGVVYCKSCKYKGVDTLMGASPLSGAVVRLECNNSRYPVSEVAKTDKKGYFFLHASNRLTNYGVHKCKMFLVSSPLDSCKKPTNLHGGLNGAYLKYEKSPVPTPFSLYTVGPFAFDPTSCPHN